VLCWNECTFFSFPLNLDFDLLNHDPGLDFDLDLDRMFNSVVRWGLLKEISSW
jgi:hypothetical protein